MGVTLLVLLHIDVEKNFVFIHWLLLIQRRCYFTGTAPYWCREELLHSLIPYCKFNLFTLTLFCTITELEFSYLVADVLFRNTWAYRDSGLNSHNNLVHSTPYSTPTSLRIASRRIKGLFLFYSWIMFRNMERRVQCLDMIQYRDFLKNNLLWCPASSGTMLKNDIPSQP